MFTQKKDNKISKSKSLTRMIIITLLFSVQELQIKSETGIFLNLTFTEDKINKSGILENDTNIVIFTNYTVFIFDWDDTVLCTSYLSSMQFL